MYLVADDKTETWTIQSFYAKYSNTINNNDNSASYPESYGTSPSSGRVALEC